MPIFQNFEKKIESASEEDLKLWTNTIEPRFSQLASDELTRRALYKLQETTNIFNTESSKQTEKMISLTRWIMFLTVAMLIGLVVQIYLILK